MNSRTTIKTRLLALVLTVLMTVGVLPFSVFAIAGDVTGGKLETEDAIYKAPTPQELVENIYNSDAKYWKPVYLSEGMSASMAGKSGRQTHYYGASYLEADANRVTGVSPVVGNDVISFTRVDSYVNGNNTVDCTNSNTWGKAGTSAWINNSGARHNGGEMKTRIWSKNMAGLDTAITFEIKPSTTSGAGNAGIFAGAQSGSTGDQPVHCILVISADGNGNFTLKSQNGDVITTLPADKFTKIQILFDFGGETLENAGNSYVVFVDGVLMASSTFTTDSYLAGLYNAQAQWNKDGGTNYHNGLSFQSINFSAGKVVYDVKGIGIYNYDDTPDDGDITNATRGIAIDIAYYNNFDNHQDSNYNVESNTSADKGKLAGTTAFINNRGIGSPSIKHVEDGNMGYAFQFSGTRRNFSLQLLKNNAQIAKNSGKSFVIAGEYKLGETSLADGQLIYGFSKGVSTNYLFCPVWLKSTGELYLIKDEWDSSNAGSDGAVFVQNAKGFDVADTSNMIAKLSADYFTHVGIFANWAENYYEVYVDGVNVSGKRVIISDAMKAKFNTDNGSIYSNGFALTTISQYTHATNGDNLVMDNVLVYFANEYYNFGGKKYDSAITAEDLGINSSLITNAYKTDSKYWVKQTLQGLDVVKDKVYYNSNFNRRSFLDGATTSPDVEGDYKSLNWEKGYAGLDMALTFEVQAQATSGSTNLQIRAAAGKNSGVWGQLFLKFFNNNGNYELWLVNNSDGTGKKLANIPGAASGQFLKVDVLFDNPGASFTNVNYYVFVGGQYAGTGVWSASNLYNGQKNMQTEWANAAGADAKPMGIMFGALAFKEGANGSDYNLRNVGVYYYDDNADGDCTDSVRKTNISAPAIKHYQDFDAIAEGNMSARPNSLLGGNVQASYKTGVTVVDDGRGGKALTTSTGGDIYYEVYPNAASGTNFVTSMDIKLTKAPTEKVCLFNGCAYNANAGSYGRDFNLGMLYLNTDGGVYLVRKTDATSEGVMINHYTDVSAYLTQKVATLNTTDFTNLAVAVNVQENTFKVYVNGVLVVDDVQFLCDSDYDLLKSTTNFSNGFGLTHRRFAIRGFMLVDNVAVYCSDDLINSKKNDNPLNGYVKDGDKYYYYKDGVIVPNFESADGLITTGADGVVKHDGNTVANMRAIYKYVGNDIVPVDGKVSGVYSLTKSGAYYCYGADKILIKGKTVDMADIIVGSDLTKPTGYKIDANGKAQLLNGMHVVDSGNTYFYVNGVRAMGFVTTADGVFFINNDYTFFAGQKTVDGKTYLFDASTGKGELLNGVFTDVEDANTPDRYYIDGVYQTGLIEANGTKYFADAIGVLQTAICNDPVSGNNYFFYTDGANKYQMAIGVSIVYGGSIITIGADGVIDADRDKVYGQWTKVGDTWYYSDASGNIQTGLAYITTGYDGNAGGYYFFDDNGIMLKDAFTEVYGNFMYFGKNGVAPTGVVFVEYTAAGFPVTYGTQGVDGEYMHFINGVLATGKTEIIQDGYMFSFTDGRLTAMKALDPNNPETLVTVFMSGRKDSFYFKTEANGVLAILLTNYPCFKLTVYKAGTNVEVEPREDGRYVLEATKAYDIRYEALEHTFDTTPCDTVAPTCGNVGYKVFACTVPGCVATHRETIAATGEHVYPDTPTQVIQAPTCVQKGLGVAWCSICGKTAKDYDIAIDPDAHSYGQWIVEYDATCAKDGIKYRECELCGNYDREIIASTGAHVKGQLTTVPATCNTPGTHTWACTNPECDYKFVEVIPYDYSNHAHGNANGTLYSYDEPEAEYFERFQVVKYSTCMENGYATYRCKDCGGFVYGVTIELDPNNHHFAPGAEYSNNGSEYLAVLDVDGFVIERVEIVNGEVLVNGIKVADADTDPDNDRDEMLSYSNKVCGYAEYAEWRIDCQNGCINSDDPATKETNDAIVWYTVVEEVEGSFMHQFDLTTKYTTTDKLDPLYGTHYYLCQKCGKAAGMTEHKYTYTSNGDGTHTATCDDGCIDEVTGLAYSEIFGCEFEGEFDNAEHWNECTFCGEKKDIATHDFVDSNNGTYHYKDCACGYQEKHTMTAIAHKDSTCCETGWKDYYDCDECDYIANFEVIPVVPHKFDGEYTVDATGHWYACTHTCNGTQCEFVYRYAEHSFVTVPELPAECGVAGHNEFLICTECGYEEGRIDYSALEHDVANLPYSYSDAEHWQVCNRCGDRVIGEHHFGILLEDENGTKKCDECGYVKTHYEFTWWYALGLNRTTENGHYYYSYNELCDTIVRLNDGNLYYFDDDGHLVLIGDTGVDNSNMRTEEHPIYDKMYEMGNTRGIITRAVLSTADGYTYYVKNGDYESGWQTLDDGKDYFFNTKFNDAIIADAPEFALIKGGATINALNYTATGVTIVNVDTNGARLLGIVVIETTPNGGERANYYLDGTAGKLIGRIEDNYYNIGNIYFTDDEGILYNGPWQCVKGVYYSFQDYVMIKWHANDSTTLDIDGTPTTIYTDGEGRRIITGWYRTKGVGGSYINNGVMLVDRECIFLDDYYYAIDSNGVASYYSGWLEAEHIHYIASGMMVKGRFEEFVNATETIYYYFDNDGVLVKAAAGQTLRLVIESWVFEIDENGVARHYEGGSTWVWFIDPATGKASDSDKGYYTVTGLVKGQAITIDDSTYIFDANGKLVRSQSNYECNGVYYIIDAEGKASLKDEEDLNS